MTTIISNAPESVPLEAASTCINLEKLHADLQGILRAGGEETAVRKGFRSTVAKYAAAIGVAHIVRSNAGNWEISELLSTGQVPEQQEFVEKLGECCERAIQRDSIQLNSFSDLEAICAPCTSNGASPEVLLVLCNKKSAGRTLRVVEAAQSHFNLWRNACLANRKDWKLNCLAALIELVSEIEAQSTRQDACRVTVNELSKYLNCKHVAVAIRNEKSERVTVDAIAGATELEPNSRTYQSFLTALNESLLLGNAASFPPGSREPSHLMLGHQAVAKELQTEAVLSTPLRLPDGTVLGALLLAGSAEQIGGDRLPNFVKAAAPRIASAIDVVTRTELSLASRLLRQLRTKLMQRRQRTMLAVLAGLIAMLFLPAPYRVRCSARLEATHRRFAVAPFEGLVEQGFVRPGDAVSKGQLVAKMDGQSLRFELASVIAQKQQAAKQREVELSAHNVSQSLLADLERKKLDAQIALLRNQLARSEIRSPIRGIVLKGSLEHAEAAAVEIGQVLFEVAPLDPVRVEIAVPSEEVAHVQEGQSVTINVEGFEDQRFDVKVVRIRPQSEQYEQRNVFIAECLLENTAGMLRPGMKAKARIDTHTKPLGWNLFHKPYYYLVSRLARW